jgi:hypothetical protein
MLSLRDAMSNRSDKNNTTIETKQAPDCSAISVFFAKSLA